MERPRLNQRLPPSYCTVNRSSQLVGTLGEVAETVTVYSPGGVAVTVAPPPPEQDAILTTIRPLLRSATG